MCWFNIEYKIGFATYQVNNSQQQLQTHTTTTVAKRSTQTVGDIKITILPYWRTFQTSLSLCGVSKDTATLSTIDHTEIHSPPVPLTRLGTYMQVKRVVLFAKRGIVRLILIVQCHFKYSPSPKSICTGVNEKRHYGFSEVYTMQLISSFVGAATVESLQWSWPIFHQCQHTLGRSAYWTAKDHPALPMWNHK